jgi:hypothetical protein
VGKTAVGQFVVSETVEAVGAVAKTSAGKAVTGALQAAGQRVGAAAAKVAPTLRALGAEADEAAVDVGLGWMPNASRSVAGTLNAAEATVTRELGEAWKDARAFAKGYDQSPVVIGETMKRVEAAASVIPGAKILNDMPDFGALGLKPHEVTSAMMQYNRNWILEQMRSGRPIVDIGRDPNRVYPSIFYDMEQNMLRNYQELHPERNMSRAP